MVSNLSIQKLFANAKIVQYLHDPDGVAAALVTPNAGTTKRVWDFRDGSVFGVLATPTVLVGAGITRVEIVACDNADGTGNVTVVKDSGVVAADAKGDYVALECTAEEVRQLSEAGGFNLRYVAARLTLANAGDEANVVYILAFPRFAQKDLTATAIA